MKRKTATVVRLRRRNEFLVYFVAVYKPKCFFCAKAIEEEDFTDYRDHLTIHHINHNHEDNAPENLTLVHRGCHISHHKGVRKVLAQMSEAVNKMEAQNGSQATN